MSDTAQALMRGFTENKIVQGEMTLNKKIHINDFYLAAYLIGQGYDCELKKAKAGRTEFWFADNKVLNRDIELYEKNVEIQNYVKGVKSLRKMLGNFRQKQKQNRDSVPVADSVAEPVQDELLNPIED
jgi:hypothetical protein